MNSISYLFEVVSGVFKIEGERFLCLASLSAVASAIRRTRREQIWSLKEENSLFAVSSPSQVAMATTDLEFGKRMN